MMTCMSKTMRTLTDFHQSEFYHPLDKQDEKLKLQFLVFQA